MPGGPGHTVGQEAYVAARYVSGRPKLQTCGKSNELVTTTTLKQPTNIRQGPNHKDQLLRTVAKGTKVQVSCSVGRGTPESRVYYRVKGGTGWIGDVNLQTDRYEFGCRRL